MGLLVHSWQLLIKMIRKPATVVLVVSIIFILFRCWSSVQCASKTREAKSPQPLFNSFDHVTDIYHGSLQQRDVLLESSEICFIMYYAPWDHNSLKAAIDFRIVANQLYKQISFIAINCWWSKGECRSSKVITRFPQTYLHHKIHPKVIHYRGPHLQLYYKVFLMKALSPIVHLGTAASIDKFMNKSQISVIGSFGSPISQHSLLLYTQVALAALEKYPMFSVQFGLIVNEHLRDKMELRKDYLKLYDLSFSDDYAFKQLEISSNLSMQDVTPVQWIFSSQFVPVLHNLLGPDEKSNYLHKILKSGPTIVFVSRDFEQIKKVEEIAIRYNKLCTNKFHCCYSLPHNRYCSVCLRDSSAFTVSKDRTISCSMLDALLRLPFQPLLKMHCFETKPVYDVLRSRLSICCETIVNSNPTNLATSINCLKQQTNRTLNFVILDPEVNQGLAETLDSTMDAVIVDVKNEEKYFLTSPFDGSNIEKFIVNYTNHMLIPRRKKSLSEDLMRPIVRVESYKENLEIPCVSADEYEEVVMKSSSDTLVYYHADWCGGCYRCSHAILTLKHVIGRTRLLKFIQIDELVNNQLPFAFVASTFPTLILYPGNRSSGSIVFPHKCTLVNLFKFLLHHASTSTKTMLLLRACDDEMRLLHHKVCKINEIKEQLAKLKITMEALREVAMPSSPRVKASLMMQYGRGRKQIRFSTICRFYDVIRKHDTIDYVVNNAINKYDL